MRYRADACSLLLRNRLVESGARACTVANHRPRRPQRKPKRSRIGSSRDRTAISPGRVVWASYGARRCGPRAGPDSHSGAVFLQLTRRVYRIPRFPSGRSRPSTRTHTQCFGRDRRDTSTSHNPAVAVRAYGCEREGEKCRFVNCCCIVIINRNSRPHTTPDQRPATMRQRSADGSDSAPPPALHGFEGWEGERSALR